MSTTYPNEPFPPEHIDFLDDFQALLKKHPRAAARFVLADTSTTAGNQGILRTRLPELECVSTEWGLVCKPISPVL